MKFPDKENIIALYDFGKSACSEVPDMSGNGNNAELLSFQGNGADFITNKQYGQMLDLSYSYNTRIKIPAIDAPYKTFVFLLNFQDFYHESIYRVLYNLDNTQANYQNFFTLGDVTPPYEEFAWVYQNDGETKRSRYAHSTPKGVKPIIFRHNDDNTWTIFVDGKKITDRYGTVSTAAWQNIAAYLSYFPPSLAKSYKGAYKLFALWQSVLDDEQCINLIKDLDAWSPKAELLRKDGSNWYLNSKFDAGLIGYDSNGSDKRYWINENGNLEFQGEITTLHNNCGKIFNNGEVKLVARQKELDQGSLSFCFLSEFKDNVPADAHSYRLFLNPLSNAMGVLKGNSGVAYQSGIAFDTEFHEYKVVKNCSSFTVYRDGDVVKAGTDSEYQGKVAEWFYAAGNWEIESYEIKYA